MDNQKITPEQIALMRKRMDDGRTVRISEVKMLIDALEASMRREDEKDAEIERLKAEVRAAKDVTQTASDECSEGCNTITQLQAEKWELQEEVVRLTAERDAEKRRADAAVRDIEMIMKLAHEWDDADAVCEACETECESIATGHGRQRICTAPKWRGPTAANTDAPTGAESENEK